MPGARISNSRGCGRLALALVGCAAALATAFSAVDAPQAGAADAPRASGVNAPAAGGVNAPAAGAAVPSPSAGWTTVFSDDFTGAANSGLDGNWQYDVGTNYPGGAPNWGTGEVETATNSTSNVRHDGSGHLLITPVRDAAGHWTSGRVESRRVDFAAPAGGQLQITASLRQPAPAAALGYWPAFWALGAAARPVGAANWPRIGELDMMEDVNGRSQVSHTFHCGVWGQPPCNEPDGIGSALLACPGCQSGYHTYSVILDRTTPGAERLRFLTDNVVQHTVNESQVGPAIWADAVDHGFFLILDVAIGGSYPNKVCGCDSLASPPTSGAAMSVDYVAVYQKAATSSTTPTPLPTPSTTPPPPASSTAPAPLPTPSTTPPPPPAPVISAGSTIQAESYQAQAGTQTGAAADAGGGGYVGWAGNGDWLRYDKVDFGTRPMTQFQARVASGAPAGVSGLVEAHLDSVTGPAIGRFEIADTGGWQSWRTVAVNMSATTGLHTLYLKFVSGSAQDFVNVNWFTSAP